MVSCIHRLWKSLALPYIPKSHEGQVYVKYIICQIFCQSRYYELVIGAKSDSNNYIKGVWDLCLESRLVGREMSDHRKARSWSKVSIRGLLLVVLDVVLSHSSVLMQTYVISSFSWSVSRIPQLRWQTCIRRIMHLN